MAQYIDKSALVAEIEKRFDEYSSSILRHYDACTEAKASELGKILVILNTLEVKEVDLEKELNDYGYHYDYVSLADRKELVDFAKHFFELGLKTQKGE